MIIDPYDEQRNPFGVFCSNPNCFFNEDNEALIDPLWSHDCPQKVGILVCPKCESPVIRPK